MNQKKNLKSRCENNFLNEMEGLHMHKMNIALCALIMAATGTSTIFPMFKSMEARRKIQGIKQDTKTVLISAAIAYAVYKLSGKETDVKKWERYLSTLIAFAGTCWGLRTGLTAVLYDAVKKGDERTVAMLLMLGANPQKTYDSSRTDLLGFSVNTTKTAPLSVARGLATIGIARRLLEYGACPNTGEVHTYRFFLSPFSYDRKEFWFPLHNTVLHTFDVPLCKLLIEHGADVNKREWDGSAPLGLAFCRFGPLSPTDDRDREKFKAALEMCALLIDNGADIKRNWDGESADDDNDDNRSWKKGPFLRELYYCSDDYRKLPSFTLNNGMNAHEFLVRKVLSKYELHELDQVCVRYLLDYKKLIRLWAEENPEKARPKEMMNRLLIKMKETTSDSEIVDPELCNEIMSFLVEQPVKKQLSIQARQKIMLQAMLERISTESPPATTLESRGEPKESKEPMRE
jgi:hypothetical protein